LELENWKNWKPEEARTWNQDNHEPIDASAVSLSALLMMSENNS
jgi:hypothetical protein